MKAVRYHAVGGPEVLRAGDVPQVEPGAGEVRVRVHVAGVNFADTERRRGLYDAAVPLPRILGSEAAGVVDAVGPGVDAGWVGAHVVAWTQRCYAEWTLAPLGRVWRVPEGVSFAQAAALPVQGLTAWHLLHTVGRVQAGEAVLVHAAAGGVGTLLVQLARAAGARVLAVVGSAQKAALAERLGASAVARSDTPDAELGEWARAQTQGRGVELALDAVGQATWGESLHALAPFGRAVYYGSASGVPPPVDLDAQLFERSLSVSAYWLATPHPEGAHARAMEDLLAQVAAGALRPVLGLTLPLDEAAEAHRQLEGRATVGKVLLQVRSGEY
ncbi:zinc-binding dehydrogenase [Aggregicoccus sp. 17bor-14]|uniref:quinone oxidoreductase family protein n=1 Tax=Myxococcaceae TaxID=31 RepID=UPI00129C7ABC|nr:MULTISPECIES: zinc-binding dehydrogenase [Myxococcaceae]MBF5045365.1 zinc-binding dehydrogenase [Simulacricoccus sp. 17bor-14]MRI91107.1 zinc-binding dehydrogenase [Aggregicoccus sp. 17bor-14]